MDVPTQVQRWTEMPRGERSAAMEEPKLLADEMRAFFRPLWTADRNNDRAAAEDREAANAR